MSAWLYAVLFLYGLVFGSFLNACIYRIPRQRSLLAGSRCVHCDARIAYYDNLPLISFLLLRGRCRRCQASIAARYPLVELATGLLFALAFWRFGYSFPFILNLLFLCMMVVLMLIDYDHKILPDVITLPGMVLGLAASPLQEIGFYMDSLSLAAGSWLDSPVAQAVFTAYAGSLLGLVVGGGLLWLVSELYFRFRRVEGLGFGDVKMMAMVGAFLGWKYALLTVFLGSISGSVVGLTIMKLQNRDSSYQLPFGTFLGMGAIAAVFVGQSLLDWYLQFF